MTSEKPLSSKVETIYDSWERISRDYYNKEDVATAVERLKKELCLKNVGHQKWKCGSISKVKKKILLCPNCQRINEIFGSFE